MANGEAGALFYLFIYLVSLLVILVYPYIALSNFTERKNIFLFYLCNIILFISWNIHESKEVNKTVKKRDDLRKCLRFGWIVYEFSTVKTAVNQLHCWLSNFMIIEEALYSYNDWIDPVLDTHCWNAAPPVLHV